MVIRLRRLRTGYRGTHTPGSRLRHGRRRYDASVLRQFGFIGLALIALALNGCSRHAVSSVSEQPCSTGWVEAVESKIASGDGQDHGPDPGSEEWQSVVEFRLGIRGSPELPDRASSDWCLYIDRLLFGEHSQ